MPPMIRAAVVLMALMPLVGCDASGSPQESEPQALVACFSSKDIGGSPREQSVAVGAAIEYRFSRFSGSCSSTFLVVPSAVEVADPEIFAASISSGGTVTLTALAPGETSITVRSTDGPSGSYEAVVTLVAQAPDVHVLGHICEAGDQAVYLAGRPARLASTLHVGNASAAPLLGFGAPVTVTGPGSLDTSYKQHGLLQVDTTGPGTLALTSDIGGTSVALELVEAATLDAIAEPVIAPSAEPELSFGDAVPLDVLAVMRVTVTAGGKPLCLQADVDVRVTSNTPEICEVAGSRGAYVFGSLAVGTCSYTVALTDGTPDATSTLPSETFSVEIVAAP